MPGCRTVLIRFYASLTAALPLSLIEAVATIENHYRLTECQYHVAILLRRGAPFHHRSTSAFRLQHATTAARPLYGTLSLSSMPMAFIKNYANNRYHQPAISPVCAYISGKIMPFSLKTMPFTAKPIPAFTLNTHSE